MELLQFKFSSIASILVLWEDFSLRMALPPFKIKFNRPLCTLHHCAIDFVQGTLGHKLSSNEAVQAQQRRGHDDVIIDHCITWLLRHLTEARLWTKIHEPVSEKKIWLSNTKSDPVLKKNRFATVPFGKESCRVRQLLFLLSRNGLA